jgi:misacylated tRNA(Ala) deacylase
MGPKHVEHLSEQEMTEAIFYQDAYLKELSARVTAVNEDWVELDRTIFYPMGGGQPGDTGTFASTTGESWRVIDTRKGATSGAIAHQLDTADHGFKVGDVLETSLDWDRRYTLMKMHTGMHLLGSLVPVGVTGGAVGEIKSRLDFDLGEHQIDKETLTAQLNQLVEAGHDIVIGSISEEELDLKPELVRTMSVQPPRGVGDIRTIRIEGIDFQPCGGTHLRNTREIGAISVRKIENKGRRNRRVHIVLE